MIWNSVTCEVPPECHFLPSWVEIAHHEKDGLFWSRGRNGGQGLSGPLLVWLACNTIRYDRGIEPGKPSHKPQKRTRLHIAEVVRQILVALLALAENEKDQRCGSFVIPNSCDYCVSCHTTKGRLVKDTRCSVSNNSRGLTALHWSPLPQWKQDVGKTKVLI